MVIIKLKNNWLQITKIIFTIVDIDSFWFKNGLNYNGQLLLLNNLFITQ